MLGLVLCDGRNNCFRRRVDTMIVVERSSLRGASELRNCFFFIAPASAVNSGKHKIFRNPFGPVLLRKIADKLALEGFRVTDPKPGRASDAGFEVSFDGFDISVVLLANQREGMIECSVLTWLCKPWWRRTLPESTLSNWTRVCDAIERVPREDLGVISAERLTEAQARSHW